ncbi:unnamed protein product [Nippostrongylus brasiliensis]|uniref:DUF4129 domain-containing protein n=1 Tax=Nippostrongylus brasiliensis TaxID=27835 RepID=A0A0N4XQW2_NIPBR|nr:unnamed protein product [Nippostrongylus brasiliensis]
MHRQGVGAYKTVLLLIYGFCFWLLIKYLLWDYVSRLLFGTYYPREVFEKRDRDLLDEIELNCDEILSGNQSAIQKAKLMQYNPHAVEKLILDTDNRYISYSYSEII